MVRANQTQAQQRLNNIIYCGYKDPAPSGRPLGNKIQCKARHQLRRFGRILRAPHPADKQQNRQKR